MFEEDEEKDTENDLKVFNAVVKWCESNEWVPFWLKPLPVLGISIITIILGFAPIGLGFMLGYLTWVIVSMSKKLRIALSMIDSLKPSLEHYPEGLEDSATVKTIFDGANIYKTRGSKRKTMLIEYLKQNLKENNKCDGKHSSICEHNMTSQAFQYWNNVLRRANNETN